MKILISERQYKLLMEELTYDWSAYPCITKKSNYKKVKDSRGIEYYVSKGDWTWNYFAGGTFIAKDSSNKVVKNGTYKCNGDKIVINTSGGYGYTTTATDTYPSQKTISKDTKKVRLIFPQSKWEEIALKLLKYFQVVTGIFKNLGEATYFLSKLKEKNVKADEFVVGSHGRFGALLFTQQGGGYEFDNSFLDNFKDVIHSNTKVFFTACHGADYLDTLKDAAERLNVGVYGSAGIYNYVTNDSEKGFYWCSPKKFEYPKGKKNINPITYYDAYGLVSIKFLSETANVDEYKYNITIKNGVFDNKTYKLTGLDKSVSKREEMYVSKTRDPFFLNELELSIASDIYFYFMYPNNKHTPHNPYSKKEKEIGYNKNIYVYIIEKIKSNEIIVEIEMNGKLINIKSLPLISEFTEVTNEFLLEKNLCKKVSKPPITWIGSELGLALPFL